jgi:drug/metabolite transporter (DMT)-like permease
LKTTTKAHLAVLSTNLFFAANFSLVKLLSPALVGAFAMNILRVGLSLCLFWTVWLAGRTRAGFDKKDTSRFLLCALTGVAINQMLFIKGLTLTSTVHASLLMLVTPLLVTVAAFWVLKERFTVFKFLGLLLGVLGALFLILQKEKGAGQSSWQGDVLIIVNAVSYSLYFILVKPLMLRYSPLHVIRWIFTLGFFMILPFAWQDFMQVKWGLFQWQHIVALAGIIVCGTFLAYFFNAYGIQHIGAGATGSYIYTQPVFAVIIALFVLHESFSWQKAAAAVLIFSGVYLVSFRRKE